MADPLVRRSPGPRAGTSCVGPVKAPDQVRGCMAQVTHG